MLEALGLMLIALAAVLLIAGEMALIRSHQLDRLSFFRDSCYRAAERLIDDPATPDAIANETASLIRILPSRAIMRGVLWRALTGKLQKSNMFAEEYATLTPHLRQEYITLWASGIMALTYNNLLLGTLVRGFMLYNLQPRAGGPDDVNNIAPLWPVVHDFAHPRAA